MLLSNYYHLTKTLRYAKLVIRLVWLRAKYCQTYLVSAYQNDRFVQTNKLHCFYQTKNPARRAHQVLDTSNLSFSGSNCDE